MYDHEPLNEYEALERLRGQFRRRDEHKRVIRRIVWVCLGLFWLIVGLIKMGVL